MRVWRIVKAVHAAAAWDGEGARLNPGRWNREGQRVVYTAESAALATLEVLVGLQSTKALQEYRLLAAELPDSGVAEVAGLPQGWQDHSAPGSMASVAAPWFEGGGLALRVPSSIAPGHNVLLNPNSLEWSQVRFVKDTPQLHPRLWA